jgi:hypothetical protein
MRCLLKIGPPPAVAIVWPQRGELSSTGLRPLKSNILLKKKNDRIIPKMFGVDGRYRDVFFLSFFLFFFFFWLVLFLKWTDPLASVISTSRPHSKVVEVFVDAILPSADHRHSRL